MRIPKVVLWFLLAIAVVGISYGAILLRRGVSTKDQPSALETAVARAARNLAIPSGARETKNPLASTPENETAGMQHFADHCAACHANDGSGNSEMGPNLYPKPPDMRLAQTQNLTDGEIFYIITNGVRMTGMPGWGASHTAVDTWKLVVFIRHLPQMSSSELKEMTRFNPKSYDDGDDQQGAGPKESGPEESGPKKPGPSRYYLTGRVVSVDKAKQQVKVDAKNIPGLMSAMQMIFAVKNPSLLDPLSPEDEITADVLVDGADVWLENIAAVKKSDQGKTPTSNGTLPALPQGSTVAGAPRIPHLDHNPKHGGTFFMALDNKHHLEGVLLPEGKFRVYLYDTFTKPLTSDQAKLASGTIQIGESEDAPKMRLAPGKVTEALEADLGGNIKFPVAITLLLHLPGMPPKAKPELYDFTFSKFTDENGPGITVPMGAMLGTK